MKIKQLYIAKDERKPAEAIIDKHPKLYSPIYKTLKGIKNSGTI